MILIYHDFYRRNGRILGRFRFSCTHFDDHLKVKASRQLRLVVCVQNIEQY